MSETGPPKRRLSSIIILIIIVALGLSVVAFYQAVSEMTYGDPTLGIYFALIGVMGIALLTYILFQTRRKTLSLPLQAQKVATTILCQKCGFKSVRDFQRGDYIFKEAEECPKCNEKMTIASIYREVKEKSKED